MCLGQDIFEFVEKRTREYKGNYESTAEVLDYVKSLFKEFYDESPEDKIRQYYDMTEHRYFLRKSVKDEEAAEYYKGRMEGVSDTLRLLGVSVDKIAEKTTVYKETVGK